MPSTPRPAAPVSDPAGAFVAFHQLVVDDAELFALLQDTPTTDAFAALAVELGAARGLPFGDDDVRAALQAARRSWAERSLA